VLVSHVNERAVPMRSIQCFSKLIENGLVLLRKRSYLSSIEMSSSSWFACSRSLVLALETSVISSLDWVKEALELDGILARDANFCLP